MPNNVVNVVRVHDTKLKNIAYVISSPKSAVDFEVLLPPSVNFWSGDVSIDHKRHFPGNHLDEARELWGTKWNAYGGPTATQDGKDALLIFQTAWDTPRGWVCALFNTLKSNITVQYLSEGAECGFIETFKMEVEGHHGRQWEKHEIPEGSAPHRHLHKLLWGVEEFESEE